ncbi:acyl-CoA dehydrogenase family protein [Salinisphaera sp. Q1T1-3]|uniref:acyl-CoA dehydrogenase family protein n=1 Tax=Salinisphaera sp. Q1T1-3 TaxID=2321229 RepID=UPI000E743400|nr:acyl-CoA dehydrogenase family protein [Salinisphaera sp. Q1T1-3]RJS94053.1 DNA alkylation response protein [Salinisphaera sp. Q1T1-3]
MDHHTPLRPRHRLVTHEVSNQPTELFDFNAFATDAPLVEALAREGGDWGAGRCDAYGRIAGGELLRLGFAANEHPPRLVSFDRFGGRIDEVDFHPAYHRCMALAREHELHSLTWTQERPGAQVVRSALCYLHNQYEAGTACPTTMTHAAVPVLRHAPALAPAWLPGVLSSEYDPDCRPPGEKRGLSIGMGMTEKQGGSDVRANTTRAVATGDDRHHLTGHKWFFSAPMSDAFIVLAQEDDEGLSCFLLPRWRSDGQRNAINVMQLKDKLGDRANASSEVEFVDAEAHRIGVPGRGVATIIEMVGQTRLDCMLGSAGLMRAALVQAIHHSRARHVFGAALVDQPLQQRVLADLALESEAAIALAMRMARAFEGGDEHEQQLARLATPIGKYWICRSAPAFVNEAQECLGGAGYVETGLMPRLFRQSPLNSIWEGAGNVQCLDMLRALARSPASRDALLAELDAARGLNRHFDTHCDRLARSFDDAAALPAAARAMAEDAAKALQAAILLRADADWVGALFCDTRLAGPGSRAYGVADCGDRAADLIARAF